MNSIIQRFWAPFVFLLLACQALLISCDKSEEIDYTAQERKAPFEVVNISDYLPQTKGWRRDSIPNKGTALKFDNEDDFERTYNELKHMTIEQRLAYLQRQGFANAEIALNKADTELEQIFDINNFTEFTDSLNAFKLKYKDLFVFNDSDEYDATPYLSFSDDDRLLLGNAQGYVIIGNELTQPSNPTPSYGSSNIYSYENGQLKSISMGPIQPGFRAYGNASLTIKNGKYQSTMTLGHIVNGDSFAIEFITKRKRFLWKKKVKASYSLNLELRNNQYNRSVHMTCPAGPRYCILGIPTAEIIGNICNAYVSNFKSSCGKATGNATFNNIRVR